MPIFHIKTKPIGHCKALQHLDSSGATIYLDGLLIEVCRGEERDDLEDEL